MHIVLVTHFFPAHGGGVERVAAQLAARMAADGHRLTWFASDTDPPPGIPGVECIPARTFNGIEKLSGMPYPLWSPAAWRRMDRAIRDADAVHLHDCIYLGSLLAALQARRHRKPWVVTQHIGPKPLPWVPRLALALAYRVGLRWALAPAAGVAFISRVGLRHFEALGGPRANFHYLPNGVDDALFQPTDEPLAALRARLGFDPQRPLMLFVGRFVPTKRLHLLREMAMLRPQWQWCLIGHGLERPQDWDLPQVRVLPPMAQADLREHYCAADLLVLPSHGEGFPLVVQEAMACGLPVCITAEVAAGATLPAGAWLALPEQPGESPARVAAGGVQAITDMLQQSAASRQSQRAACAAHARQQWSWAGAVDAHLQWLRAAPSRP